MHLIKHAHGFFVFVGLFFQHSSKDALRRELWINISKYGRLEKDPLGKQYLSKLKKMANSMSLKK